MRRVKARRDGQDEWVELTWSEGPQWRVKVEGSFGCPEGRGDDLFSALLAVRKDLDELGWLLQVNGARTDAWPSQMALQAGGLRLYILRLGEPASPADLVSTLDEISDGEAGTVLQQEAFAAQWRRSLRHD